MSEPDRRRQAEAIVRAVERRDFDALIGLGYHDGVEFHSVISTQEGSFYRGLEGMREWAAMIDEMWIDFRYEIVDTIDAPGDRLLIVFRVTATARLSGVPLEAHVAQLWEWCDGVLFRNRSFSNVEDAYRAAGLTEDRP